MTRLTASKPDPTYVPELPIFDASRGYGSVMTLGFGEVLNPGTTYTAVTKDIASLPGYTSCGVFLCYGQSNLANNVNGTYTLTNTGRVFNLNARNGELYTCKEPMLGCDGNLNYGGFTNIGNWSMRLGDKLVTAGKYSHVVLINVAVSGSGSDAWAVGGLLNQRLIAGCNRALQFPFPLTAVIRHQGERDHTAINNAATTTANLLSERATIEAQGITAPTLVCIVSAAGQVANNTRTGQANACNGTTMQNAVDSDAIGNRYDTVHFNTTGADQMATAMSNYIVANL